MPENHSRAGKRVEQLSVNTQPHDDYRKHDPWTGKAIFPGIPILKSLPGGNVIEKDVTYSEMNCPNCRTTAYYDEDSEPVCPECGVVCSGKSGITHEIIIDAKTTGRVDGAADEV